MLLLPIRTDRPRIRPAYLTLALITVNTLVQVLARVLPKLDPFRFGPVPFDVHYQGRLIHVPMPWMIHHFGLWGNHPTVLTMFSHQFVHADELHLLGNMLFLWIFGSLIEDVLRPWGLAALYLGGGLMAGFSQIAMATLMGYDVAVPLVGASGAIAAIMGLFALRFYKTRIEIFWWFFVKGSFWVQSIWALGVWVGLEVLEGLVSTGHGVAHWAHVGGFFAGLLAAPFLGSVSAAKREYFTDDPETNVEYIRRHEQVTAAERALKADPQNVALMRKVAIALRRAGEYEEATRAYERCVYRLVTLGQLDQAALLYLELLQYNDSVLFPPEIQLKLAVQLESTQVALAFNYYQYLFAHYPMRSEGEYSLLRLATLYGEYYRQPQEALRCLTDFLYRYPNSQWIDDARRFHDNLAAEHL